jgi:hypothetical protein
MLAGFNLQLQNNDIFYFSLHGFFFFFGMNETIVLSHASLWCERFQIQIVPNTFVEACFLQIFYVNEFGREALDDLQYYDFVCQTELQHQKSHSYDSHENCPGITNFNS